jgi:rhodanese-related sulfurtransferase
MNRKLLFQVFLLLAISVGCSIVFKWVSGTTVPLIGNFDLKHLKDQAIQKEMKIQQSIEYIESHTLHNLLQNEMAFLIDTRPQIDFKNGHIPPAVNIEAIEPLDETEYLSVMREAPSVIVIYGHNPDDKTPATLARKLQKHGMKSILIYRKGFSEWVAQKYPVEKAQ